MGVAVSKEVRKYSIINGLILGLIMLGLSIISFYLITTVVKSPIGVIAVPYLFSMILPIPCAIILCYVLRVRIGFPWDMRIATSGIFIMFLVAYIVISVGRDLVFAQLIEPQMNTKIENVLLAATPVALKKSGANEQQIAERQKQIRDQFILQDHATVWQKIQSQVITVIFIFVVAVIFGGFFKRPAAGYTTYADNHPVS
jgi:hypothetical protein